MTSWRVEAVPGAAGGRHPASTGGGRDGRRAVLVWTGALALLVAVSSVAGLVDPSVYEQETEYWALQARGQDLGNLAAVVVLVASALRYAAGSARAGLVWLGTLLYLVYAFVVYAMAVHFNRLFLVYVAVLGLSAWGLLLRSGEVRRRLTMHADGRWRVVPAGVLVVVGVLFAGLWLAELVPAVLTGQVPSSVLEARVWVNPIHVIDLSVVLPAFVLTGVAAIRGRGAGLFWLGPWLVFSALMGSSIVAAMVLIAAADDGAGVVPAVMVSLVVVASLVSAWVFLRHVPGPAGEPDEVSSGA